MESKAGFFFVARVVLAMNSCHLMNKIWPTKTTWDGQNAKLEWEIVVCIMWNQNMHLIVWLSVEYVT